MERGEEMYMPEASRVDGWERNGTCNVPLSQQYTDARTQYHHGVVVCQNTILALEILDMNIDSSRSLFLFVLGAYMEKRK